MGYLLDSAVVLKEITAKDTHCPSWIGPPRALLCASRPGKASSDIPAVSNGESTFDASAVEIRSGGGRVGMYK